MAATPAPSSVIIQAVRIGGTDASALTRARGPCPASNSPVEPATVGSKDVLSLGGDPSVYVSDDVIFFVSASNDEMAQATLEHCHSRCWWTDPPSRAGSSCESQLLHSAARRGSCPPCGPQWAVMAARWRQSRPRDMAATVLRAVVERAPLDRLLVEDVILGCANQADEDNRDVARMAVLLAGFPVEVGGLTVNRLCGSGLQAISLDRACGRGRRRRRVHRRWRRIDDTGAVRDGEARDRPGTVARASLQDTTLGWRFVNPKLANCHPYSMGETAENVAERWGVSRERQDVRARKPPAGGRGHRGWPLRRPARPGRGAAAEGRPGGRRRDEHPADSTLEALAKLRPAFAADGGSVTAGNASGINDGASAVLLVEAERARELGLHPMARVVSTAVVGVDPSVMGIGPIPASRKALARAGIGVEDLDLIELNEAFASQSLVCIDELGLDPSKVNVNGGAIALGHPLGMAAGGSSRCWPTSCAGPAVAATSRRCASGSGRGSRRSRTDRRVGVNAPTTVPRRTRPTPTATSTSDWVTRSAHGRRRSSARGSG